MPISTHEDACKYQISPKKCISKTSSKFLGTIASFNNKMTLTLNSPTSYVVRVDSSVKRNFKLILEEISSNCEKK